MKVNRKLSGVFIQPELTTIVPSFSPIEPLKILEHSDGSLSLTTDTYLLLNQERIKNYLGEDTFRSYINSLNAAPKKAKSFLETSPDEIKSRYIQSPSELKSYTEDLISRWSRIKEQHEELVQSDPSASQSDSNSVNS
ncbi:MAG: hypothetical protein O2U61_02885 [Candidatus Bathyarchaeota archaeon]|nr:hypothetical protein [Candidatus Bathyarchaeota archaeon]